MRNKVVLFDFDGTLTTRDTLFAFIVHAKGAWRLCLALLRYAPMLMAMRLRLYDNGMTKQRLFAHFFKGMDAEAFDRLCQAFARDCRDSLLRPQGMAELRRALAEGAQVFVVSASIDNWVRPFFATLPQGALHVVGTQVEAIDGRLTGRFLTPNCYGAEKVRRIEAVLPLARAACHVVAFGDSRGDKEMLSYADEAHFKPFR